MFTFFTLAPKFSLREWDILEKKVKEEHCWAITFTQSHVLVFSNSKLLHLAKLQCSLKIILTHCLTSVMTGSHLNDKQRGDPAHDITTKFTSTKIWLRYLNSGNILEKSYMGGDKSLARPGRKQIQRQKILSFIYPIYNHKWRNISTTYIYIYKTRLTSKEIFSLPNKIHREVGRAKDLSAPL